MQRVVSLYQRYPAAVTLAAAAALLALAWSGMFFGGLVAPFDYRTADYPAYVDAVRAARYSVFCLFNPFNDGGVQTPNLIAKYDPVEWLALFGTGIPGYAAAQAAYLAHLVLVPVGLLLAARANGVPRSRWILVAGISLIAYACGPCLKYLQHTTAVPAFSCYVFLFGALEAYRRFGGFHYVVLAGVAFAYANGHWVYGTVFFPILLTAYVAANARAFFGSPRRAAESAGAAAISLAIVWPNVVLDLKFDRTIEFSRHVDVMFNEIQFAQIPGLLGAPLPELALLMLPAGLLVLVVTGLRNSSPVERWLYGLIVAVLVVYAFGDLTPFGPVFRTLYPPAALIRRPYAVWYVLLPFLLVLSARGLAAPSARVALGVVLAAAGATCYAWFHGAPALASAVVLASLAAIAWRPQPPVVVAAAVVQWAAIAWIPFWHSGWQPGAIPAQSRYFAPYASVRPYIAFETNDSANAYRVANVGLPAEFGPSAGAWKMYGSAATYNTSAPHELISLLGTQDVHATVLPAYFRAHPDRFADANWERLGVRYYLMAPDAAALIPRRAFAKPRIRTLDVPGYWKVVEDTAAAPFVSALLANGTTVAVHASMRRDSYEFTVPPDAALVRFANIYDPWWTVTAVPRPPPGTVIDDRGQLVIDASDLRGREVRLVYTNRVMVAAIATRLAVHAGLAVGAIVLALRAIRRRRRVLATA